MAATLIRIVSITLLFFLIAGISAGVDVAVFKTRFTASKRGIAVGLVSQFVLMPFAGFLSATIFSLDPIFGITLLATTCSPGGAFSNLWCSLFNADLALSVAMTACSTLFSMLCMPLNLFLYVRSLYGKSVPLDWFALANTLVVALTAIVTGLAASAKRPDWRCGFNMAGNVAGGLLMVLGALTSSRKDPLWDKDVTFYLSVSLPCVIGLAVAFLGARAARLSGPQCVAVSVESCYQNTGVALSLALATFDKEDQSQAAGVPLYYGVVEVVVLALFLVVAWKAGLTYAPASERLCTVLVQNFQPLVVEPTVDADTGDDAGEGKPDDVEQFGGSDATPSGEAAPLPPEVDLEIPAKVSTPVGASRGESLGHNELTVVPV